MNKVFLLSIMLFALLVSGCSLSLAGDVLPPPDINGATDVPPGSFPVSLPDPEQGRAIYLEKCAPCHGDTGRGDGNLASRAASPVPDIQSRASWLKASPAAWYRMVTEGNMARGMPPFSSLSDQQRWNVVAYALSLGMDAEALQSADALFKQECAACHGENGRGASSGESASPADWTNPAVLAGFTGQQLVDAVSAGRPPAMPAYAEKLTQEQRFQLAVYTRALAFFGGPQQLIAAKYPAPLNSSGNNPQPGSFNIHGSILLPDSLQPGVRLPVTLHGYDQMEETFQTAAESEEDGSFVFRNVEVVSGRIYLVTVEYEGLTYNSEFLAAEEVGPLGDVNLSISVYPASSDPGLLTADRLHVILDLSSKDQLQVGEILVFSNRSNRVVLPVQDGQPTLRIRLPDQAADLAFEENGATGNMTPFGGGFAYLAPVEPGSSRQILFGYSLPFSRRLDLSLALPMNTEEIVVMVTGGEGRLTSEQLTFSGTRNIQGTQVQIYTGRGLSANQPLAFTLVRFSLVPVFLIGGAILMAAAGMMFFGRKKPAPAASDVEGESVRLMDAIIALDDQHRIGEVSDSAFQKRRQELLEALRVSLRSGDGTRHSG